MGTGGSRSTKSSRVPASAAPIGSCCLAVPQPRCMAWELEFRRLGNSKRRSRCRPLFIIHRFSTLHERVLPQLRVIRKDVEEKIMSNQMSEPQIQKLRKKIIILGEVIVVLSVAILFFASLLDAGV